MFMPEKDPKVEAQEILNKMMEVMEAIIRKEREVVRLSERTELLADDIALEVKDCVDLARGLLSVLADDAVRLPIAMDGSCIPRPRSKRKRRLLEEIARRGVASLTIDQTPDGSARVRVEGGDSFDMPRMGAELLALLAEPGGRNSPDGFVGWKTPDEIRFALRKRLGKKVSPRALAQGVCRLRDRLSRNGVNPELVQTRRGDGYRFALRIKETPGRL